MEKALPQLAQLHRVLDAKKKPICELACVAIVVQTLLHIKQATGTSTNSLVSFASTFYKRITRTEFQCIGVFMWENVPQKFLGDRLQLFRTRKQAIRYYSRQIEEANIANQLYSLL